MKPFPPRARSSSSDESKTNRGRIDSATPSTRLRLRLTATAESIVRAGHPWVFADSVREQNRDGVPGEIAVIFDRNDRFLAVGFFDPESPIRVRVLHAGRPLTIDTGFWRGRLEATVRRRDGLFNEQTTGFRLINGESDGWPGLVLDRYDTTLVMKIYTAAWLTRVEEILSLIRERLQPERIILRLSRNLQSAASSGNRRRSRREEAHNSSSELIDRSSKAGLSLLASDATKPWNDSSIVFEKRAGAETGAPVVFREYGLKFEAVVLRGQKTGFFLDQRENRRIVGTLAGGRSVLNAFSFSGGFSIYAAHGGANSVTDLDISAHALESAGRNFHLNKDDAGVMQCRHEFIQADAFEWLAGNAARKFDLIVLDPPSLAKRETERAGAIRAYGKLAADGIAHLSPGGILVVCSCSAHVSAEEFFGAMRQAVTQSGRKFTELRTTRHAADHHATFKEAEYLKAIFLSCA